MQGDGTLVIYNGDWAGIWSTGSWGYAGMWLAIANDEMVITAAGGTHGWAVSLRPTAPGTATEARTGALMSPRGPFGDASARRRGAKLAASPLMIAFLPPVRAGALAPA